MYETIGDFDLEHGMDPFMHSSGHIHVTRMSDLHKLIDEGLTLRSTDVSLGSEWLSKLLYIPPETLIGHLMKLDPYSEDYGRLQMQLYEQVAGSPHSTTNEGHEAPDERVGPPPNPFPFFMEPSDAGYWTVVYGHILQTLNVAKGAKILEIGYGPGGLTELLVRAGLDVTGVEVRESNGRFIKRRVNALGLGLHTIVGDVSKIDLVGNYQRIVFFESFHHIPNFRHVLSRLLQNLERGGAILFAAEPIVPEDSPIVPYPWGVRLDGGALAAGRDVGWLEIGFRQGFIHKMLNELGLAVSEHFLPNYHHSNVVIGQWR